MCVAVGGVYPRPRRATATAYRHPIHVHRPRVRARSRPTGPGLYASHPVPTSTSQTYDLASPTLQQASAPHQHPLRRKKVQRTSRHAMTRPNGSPARISRLNPTAADGHAASHPWAPSSTCRPQLVRHPEEKERRGATTASGRPRRPGVTVDGTARTRSTSSA